MLHHDDRTVAIRNFDSMVSRMSNSSGDSAQELDDVIFSVAKMLFTDDLLDKRDLDLLGIIAECQTAEQRKLAAICFLRLLPTRFSRLLDDSSLRPKIVQHIESQLGDDIYKNKKEAANLQTHEKVDRISAIVRDAEENYEKSLTCFTSLNKIKTHRQRLMSVINGRLGRILFQPFLPSDIESLFSDFYNLIEKYSSSSEGSNIVETHRDIFEETDHILEILKNTGTSYALMLIENVINKSRDLVDQDFISNEAAQPADVNLKLKDKKYPLSAERSIVHIGLLVKNNGPGYANGILINLLEDDALSLQEDCVEVGRLAPGTSQFVEIPSIVKKKTSGSLLVAELRWTDFDGTGHAKQFEFELIAQRADVDWENLSRSDPYSLEPVISESELVGRKDLLNRLIGTAQATSVGSAIIYGQKRVGKTSIARALQSHLKDEQGYIVVYLEGGDYVEPNPNATISRLGKALCREIRSADTRVSSIALPEFNEALSPLVEYLNQVLSVLPEYKIIFILDEFDELPIELYMHGAVGDSFFLTIRSISSRQRIGFIVVGSEKMAHVIDSQGDKLNKWKVHQVDYFTRETDWPDYCDLVRRPVCNDLNFTDGALQVIHSATSGNPYFTKLICQQILYTAIQRRDNYITDYEVNQAIETESNQIEKNAFQHFWEDGIFASGQTGIEKSVRRRKILIAVSDTLLSDGVASVEKITQHTLCKDIHSLAADLAEFVTRKVLVEKTQGYEFKVNFFGQWLKRKGINDLISTFSDLDVALLTRQAAESDRVKSSELVELVNKWKSYKGQAITEDKVRAWLEQFGGPKEQRCMFKLLQGLRFYGTDVVRHHMAEAYTIVNREIVWEVASGKSGKPKRSDILVSYLDGPAKSGSFLARLFADEARIYADNVVEQKNLVNVINRTTSAKALVFLDDFIGTGNSAAHYLRSIDAEICSLVNERKIKCFFVAVASYLDGWKKIEKTEEILKMNLQAHSCDIIEKNARCFSDDSIIFSDSVEREKAKALASLYGRQLLKKNPLGYGNLELAIVFERGCPNNSLPILWAESTNPKWIALFKRK